MIGGVNFQPGQTDPTQGVKKKPAGDQGVQEAIKVLSLRLPRVVGAQSVAPAPLLNSAGSGGNRVDSVVNQVMGRMFPSGPPPGGAPMVPPTMGAQPGQSSTQPVRFEGVPQTPMMRDLVPDAPWSPPPGFAPRIVVDNPTTGQGDFSVGAPGGGGVGGVVGPPPAFDDGSGQPPASIASGPDWGNLGGSAASNPFADLLDFLRRQNPGPPPSESGNELI